MPNYTLRFSTGDTTQLRNRDMTSINYEVRDALAIYSRGLPGPVTGTVHIEDDTLYPVAHVRPNGDWASEGDDLFLYLIKGKPVTRTAPLTETEMRYWVQLDTDDQMVIEMEADRMSRVGPEAVKRARQFDAPGHVMRAQTRHEAGSIVREHGPDGRPTYHFLRRKGARP